jgi:hypothetical protein
MVVNTILTIELQDVFSFFCLPTPIGALSALIENTFDLHAVIR